MIKFPSTACKTRGFCSPNKRVCSSPLPRASSQSHAALRPKPPGCALPAGLAPTLCRNLHLWERAGSSTSAARRFVWAHPSHIVQNRQIKQHKPSCSSRVYVDYLESRLSPVGICSRILARQFFMSLIRLKAYIHGL